MLEGSRYPIKNYRGIGYALISGDATHHADYAEPLAQPARRVFYSEEEVKGMRRRMLGGLEVSAVGLGCATMTPFYDEPDRDAAIDTLRHAREIGIDFLDSSDAYGQGHNEELIARAV
jgi:hypothetical protein